MKASYNERPAQLELMPDGYHLFRFDIEEVVNGENTQFTCREVQIFGAVTTQKIIEAVISEKWGGGVEQKLINDYNEYLLGIGDEAAKVAYEAFLVERKALKMEVKFVFSWFGKEIPRNNADILQSIAL